MYDCAAMPPSRLARMGALLAAAIVVAALVARAGRPPAVVPATAPDTVFSADRAMGHVRAIAQRPHLPGSAEHARVRAYLVAELRALGLDVQVQETVGVGTRYPMAGTVRNILGRLPGRERTGRAVLLVSHYDSQGASPGAGDAASGTAAILETVRALRAAPALRHDVIVLLTDAEEAGLLGAAAFAREHPWVKDVGVILNFEARGTGGRAFMFETGAGNLDAVRVLGDVPDVSATSLMVMVYRLLPNDTDLSEFMHLGIPSMNFAFIDGVERYHTAYDDVAHLDPRSVQHHGAQALALTRRFGDGPLPRPATGDAVFFEAPFAGLVVYPEAWRWPITLLALAMVLALLVLGRRQEARWFRSVALGAAGAIAALLLAPAAGAGLGLLIVWMHRAAGWGGAPEWREGYHAAVVAIAAGVAAAAWVTARRRASTRGAHAGALLPWAVLATVVTWLAPGASYIVAWPLVAAAAAALVTHASRTGVGAGVARAVALTVAALVAAVILVPVIYLLGSALGIQLAGAVAASLLTAFLFAMVAPALEWMAGRRRWALALVPGSVALALLAHGAATVRPSSEYPTRASVTHEIDAAGGGAALPRAELLRETTGGGVRTVAVRVLVPDSTHLVRIGASGPVRAATVAGHAVDRSRYRRTSGSWSLGYAAPPDTGVVLELVVADSAPLRLDLVAHRAGVPDSVRRRAARGPTAVPSQAGDLTLVRWSGSPGQPAPR